VIITHFHIIGVTIDVTKGDSPLVVNGNGALPLSVAFECMEKKGQKGDASLFKKKGTLPFL